MKFIELPEKAHIASIDVDAQNCFTPLCPEELPVKGGNEIASQLNAQAAFGVYRVGTKDAHPANAHWVANDISPIFSEIDGDNMDVRWPPHAVPGTNGFELIEGLPHPSQYDFFIWKGIEPDMHPYGNCYHDFAEKLSTGLIEFLRDKCITTVLVGGLTTDYCVKTTVLQLARAGFHIIVNLGACRGIAEDTVEAAIAEMKAAGVAFIESTEQLRSTG